MVLYMLTGFLAPISGTATHDDTKTTTPQKQIDKYDPDILFRTIMEHSLRQTIPQRQWVYDINKLIYSYTGNYFNVVVALNKAKAAWKKFEKAMKTIPEWKELKKAEKNFEKVEKDIPEWKKYQKMKKKFEVQMPWENEEVSKAWKEYKMAIKKIPAGKKYEEAKQKYEKARHNMSERKELDKAYNKYKKMKEKMEKMEKMEEKVNNPLEPEKV